jgi:hypothetical protein
MKKQKEIKSPQPRPNGSGFGPRAATPACHRRHGCRPRLVSVVAEVTRSATGEARSTACTFANSGSGHHTFTGAGATTPPPRTTTALPDLATLVTYVATSNWSGRHGRRRRRWGRGGCTSHRGNRSREDLGGAARGRRLRHRRWATLGRWST